MSEMVLFMGNRNDVNRLYQAMDVFVLPSRYEGLPVVGVEAQAEGLPCILSDKMTQETKITENVVFISLDEGPRNWAKAAIGIKNITRNTPDIIEKFDINVQALKLTRYYDTLLRERKMLR